MSLTAPFCTFCGLPTDFRAAVPHACDACGAPLSRTPAAFCHACGSPVRGGLDTPGSAAETRHRGVLPFVRRGDRPVPRLAVLDDAGEVVREIPLDREEIVVGRTRGDVRFDDDETLSPEHALLTWRDDALRVRDLGSSNGSWLFITTPHPLVDGDLLLLGSQIIRFRALAASTASVASPFLRSTEMHTPRQDVALLEQLRPDGTVRDVLYLSPGRIVLIGREQGDWVFPYDPTMSARHAEVRAASEEEPSSFVLRDVGSRNGVAVLVRGEREVNPGERLLLGKKVLRAELS